MTRHRRVIKPRASIVTFGHTLRPMVSFVANLLAILSIVALVASAALLVFWVTARGSIGQDEATVATSARGWLSAGWVVAAIAMSGSLFFSEVAKFVPCQLCWYQRIAMYPLVIVIGIAAVRDELRIRPYVLALCLIGAAVSVYHMAVQHIPGIPSGSCSLDAPCTAIYVEVFGFVTIPFMAFSAFALIISLMLAGPLLARRTASEVDR
jgi:disulfide bond formation protein DsbB